MMFPDRLSGGQCLEVKVRDFTIYVIIYAAVGRRGGSTASGESASTDRTRLRAPCLRSQSLSHGSGGNGEVRESFMEIECFDDRFYRSARVMAA